MSLEEVIKANTAAVERLAAVLHGQGELADIPAFLQKNGAKTPAPAAAPKAAETKPAAKAAEPKKEVAKKPDAKPAEDPYAPVREITLRIHKEKGRPAAEALLAEFDCEKSAKELKPDQYDAYLERAKAVLAEEEVA